MADEIPQDHMWPKSVPELKVFDDLLRCNICYEYMKTTMMTPCSHNYCSLCIRKFLIYKPKCPKCFETTAEPLLRNNRLLDELIECYLRFRDKLLETLVRSQNLPSVEKSTVINNAVASVSTAVLSKLSAVQSSENNSLDSDFVADTLGFRSPSSSKHKSSVGGLSERQEQILHTTPKSGARYSTKNCLFQNSISNIPVDQNKTDHKIIAVDSLCLQASSPSVSKTDESPSTSSKTTYPMFSKVTSPLPSSKMPSGKSCSNMSVQSPVVERSNPNPASEVAKVSCPVCQVDIPERNINVHLDSCLQQLEPRSEPRKNMDRRKPLPKLVYDLLKEKDLRKKVKDLGLNPQGDRKSLITRHQRYTILHNAECDKLNPRSVAELIQEVEREEKEEKKVSSTAIPVVKLTCDRKTDPKVIIEEQQQYLKHHNSHFQQLIEGIKKRGGNKKVSSEDEEKGVVKEGENKNIPAVNRDEPVSPHMSPVLFASLSPHPSSSSSEESNAIPPSQVEPQDPDSNDSVSLIAAQPETSFKHFSTLVENNSPEEAQTADFKHASPLMGNNTSMLHNGIANHHQTARSSSTPDPFPNFDMDFDFDHSDFEEVKETKVPNRRGRRRKQPPPSEDCKREGTRILRKRKKP